MVKAKLKYLAACLLLISNVYAQQKLQILQLPYAINNVNQEFSGITRHNNRVYFLPQYGSHYDTKLKGAFNIYSISADSIDRAIEGKDSLHFYRTIKVKNLNKLPKAIVDNYQGFEAISIINQQVYLPIETRETHYYCYILKGTLDTVKNEIEIDSEHYISIRRYPYIKNGGFESLTYLPKEKKLLAYYEFNAMPNGGIGYLIDPAFKKSPQAVKTPFLYFRMTDMATAADGSLYGINSYYYEDYDKYLNNGILMHPEDKIKVAIPDLAQPINTNANYLKEKTTNYSRIITQKNYRSKWTQVATFDGNKNNWEGITLFKKGALVITDANRSNKQLSTFGYIEFK
jgi:hypothetical protein